MKVRGDALIALGSFVLSYSDGAAQGDDGASECSAELSIDAADSDGSRSIVIEGSVTRAADAPPDSTAECIQGRRVVRLAGSKLVEAGTSE